VKETAELLRNLIQIPSPSGKEQAISEYVTRRLRRSLVVLQEDVGGGRANVLASLGTPKVVLTTHMDTVPGELPCRLSAGRMYGRGACDAKGAMAAMILAAESAAKKGVEGFALLLDVGEETTFDGILAGMSGSVARLSPDMVVVGEPTSLRLLTGQRGLIHARMRTRGRAAHAALPEQGECAITALCRLVETVRAMPRAHDPLLGRSTVTVTRISGGSASNVVADAAWAELDIRTVPGDEHITAALRRLLTAQVDISCSFPPAICGDEHVIGRLARLLAQKGLPSQPGFAPFFTEMRFWSEKAPAVILGPGNPAVAHSEREYVTVPEVETASALYEEILMQFCP